MPESITCQPGLLAAGGGQAVPSGERGTGRAIPVPPHCSRPSRPLWASARGLPSVPGQGCGMRDAGCGMRDAQCKEWGASAESGVPAAHTRGAERGIPTGHSIAPSSAIQCPSSANCLLLFRRSRQLGLAYCLFLLFLLNEFSVTRCANICTLQARIAFICTCDVIKVWGVRGWELQ